MQILFTIHIKKYINIYVSVPISCVCAYGLYNLLIVRDTVITDEPALQIRLYQYYISKCKHKHIHKYIYLYIYLYVL